MLDLPNNSIIESGYSVCPGNHFAEATLFLLISSLMYVFDIRRAVDENGDEIVPEVKMALDSNLTWQVTLQNYIVDW